MPVPVALPPEKRLPRSKTRFDHTIESHSQEIHLYTVAHSIGASKPKHASCFVEVGKQMTQGDFLGLGLNLLCNRQLVPTDRQINEIDSVVMA
jgi:hypothetical protein